MADIRVNVINSYIKKHGLIHFNMRMVSIRDGHVCTLTHTFDPKKSNDIAIQFTMDINPKDVYCIAPSDIEYEFGERGLQVIYETLVDKMNLYELLNVALTGGIKC